MIKARDEIPLPAWTNPAVTSRDLNGIRSAALAPSLTHDDRALASVAVSLQHSGVAPERIYNDLLIPVARALGEMWEHDECSFADVTTGLLRLQNAQRVLSPVFRGKPKVDKRAPRVLLMPMPGEQHTFGLSIVADYFARSGWDTWHATATSETVALSLVRREHVDIVGLSFACEDKIAAAARLVANLRRRPANPKMFVVVGGPLLVADPGLAAQVGADGTAVDGHQAVLCANKLIGRECRPLSPGD